MVTHPKSDHTQSSLTFTTKFNLFNPLDHQLFTELDELNVQFFRDGSILEVAAKHAETIEQ